MSTRPPFPVTPQIEAYIAGQVDQAAAAAVHVVKDEHKVVLDSLAVHHRLDLERVQASLGEALRQRDAYQADLRTARIELAREKSIRLQVEEATTPPARDWLGRGSRARLATIRHLVTPAPEKGPTS